jgi:hypothetical protein
VAIALLGTVQAGPGLAAAWGRLEVVTRTPACSVTALRQLVSRDPTAWLGRTVLAQGRAVRYHTWRAPDSIVTDNELLDADAPGGSPGLSLVWGRGDPLLTALRRLPLLGRLAPPMQAIRWGVRATYRVQLRLAPPASCAALPCIEAVVLDATPARDA